jgi:hypothetical protein
MDLLPAARPASQLNASASTSPPTDQTEPRELSARINFPDLLPTPSLPLPQPIVRLEHQELHAEPEPRLQLQRGPRGHRPGTLDPSSGPDPDVTGAAAVKEEVVEDLSLGDRDEGQPSANGDNSDADAGALAMAEVIKRQEVELAALRAELLGIREVDARVELSLHFLAFPIP